MPAFFRHEHSCFPRVGATRRNAYQPCWSPSGRAPEKGLVKQQIVVPTWQKYRISEDAAVISKRAVPYSQDLGRSHIIVLCQQIGPRGRRWSITSMVAVFAVRMEHPPRRIPFAATRGFRSLSPMPASRFRPGFGDPELAAPGWLGRRVPSSSGELGKRVSLLDGGRTGEDGSINGELIWTSLGFFGFCAAAWVPANGTVLTQTVC